MWSKTARQHLVCVAGDRGQTSLSQFNLTRRNIMPIVTINLHKDLTEEEMGYLKELVKEDSVAQTAFNQASFLINVSKEKIWAFLTKRYPQAISDSKDAPPARMNHKVYQLQYWED